MTDNDATVTTDHIHLSKNEAAKSVAEMRRHAEGLEIPRYWREKYSITGGISLEAAGQHI